MKIGGSRLLLLSTAVYIDALLSGTSLGAQLVTIDTASARAVLKALQNPDLTHDQTMVVAKLEGNQG